jgi:hypothetical protein
MITVIGTHEVKDAKAWKAAFDADTDNRTKHGIHVNGVYAGVEHPNMITINMKFPSKEAFEGMINSPEMQKTMEAAGVISKPEFKILTEI